MKNKVAAVVFNTVLRDARVIKEAKTLNENGFDIEIFGIQDNNNCFDRKELSDGLFVNLVDWKSRVGKNRPFYLYISKDFFIILLFSILFFCYSRYIYLSDNPGIIFVLTFTYLSFLSLYLFFLFKKVRNLGGLRKNDYIRSTLVALKGKTFFWMFLYRSLLLFYKLRRYKVWEDALTETVIAYNPDIVHCHDLFTVNIGLKVKEKTGAKVVYDSHEIFTKLSTATPLWDWYYSRFEKKISGKIDAFITINQSIADYLKDKYPSLPPAHLVKNATSLPEDDLVYDGRLHRAAGLSLDRKILLYQGGYSQHRGLVALAMSAPDLPKDWTIVFMGWGSFESELRRVAAESDPENEKVKFIDPAPQSELVFWSAGAAVGIIPYENVSLNHWFCTPNKLWEFPVAGVPIICSPFPELKKVVEMHNVGWLIDDPVTPKSIVAVLSDIKDDEIKFKKRACSVFVEKDNWGVYAKTLVELYSNLSQ